jgi:hypothetical protein
MASRLTEIVVDCHDPAVLAAFWTAALDYHVVSTEGDQVEIAAWPTAGPGVPTLVFVPVPEGKSVKNRMHLDIRPVDRPYADELQRLVELGARRADIGQGDVPWVVLADPEGNEFCLLGPLDGDA